jgi:hypothetical protein
MADLRAPFDWACDVLIDAGAAQACPEHDDKCFLADEKKLPRARQYAKHFPFDGLEPDEAVQQVQSIFENLLPFCEMCSSFRRQ